MHFQFKLVSFLVGAVLMSTVACSSAPSSNQNAPTVAAGGGAQATTAPASTSVPSAGSAQPTQVTSALPTVAPTQAPAAPSPTTANNPPASGSSAFDFIVAAMQAQDSSKSFRSTAMTTLENGTTTTTIVEFVAPDRINEIINSGSPSPTEIIAIKGQGSWQNLKGKWFKSPIDLGAAAFALLDPKNIEQIRSSVDIGTVQFVGPALLGTTPTFVYQYNQAIKGAGPGGTDLKGSYKVWVGATDRRLYKSEGDTDSLTKPGAKIHSVITYEYDINIQIQQPS